MIRSSGKAKKIAEKLLGKPITYRPPSLKILKSSVTDAIKNTR